MNVQYTVLYFEINLFSLILIWIILRKTRGLSKMVSQRNFAMSIVAEMVFIASDTICVLISNNAIPGNGTSIIAFKTIYFFSTTVMCYFWVLYFEYLREATFVKERYLVMLSSVLVWIMALLLFANLWGKFLFYIDDNGVYTRGKLFVLNYVISYAYIFISWVGIIASIIRKTSSKDTSTLVALVLFPIAPGIAGIIQFYFPWVPAACVTMSLATLILYQTWIDQLISIDPLTGLNNRKQLQVTFEQWNRTISDQEKVFMLLVDANHFKHINDTYGHLQGDNALKMIAKALRLGCKDYSKRTLIARYGGDEFVVLMASDAEWTKDELKNGIKDRLAEIVDQEKLPFMLTVSIGTACMEEGDSLKDLVAKADSAMYEEKKSAH